MPSVPISIAMPASTFRPDLVLDAKTHGAPSQAAALMPATRPPVQMQVVAPVPRVDGLWPRAPHVSSDRRVLDIRA